MNGKVVGCLKLLHVIQLLLLSVDNINYIIMIDNAGAGQIRNRPLPSLCPSVTPFSLFPSDMQLGLLLYVGH